MDDELFAEAKPFARELNLSPKGLQKLVDLKAKDLALAQRRWGDHLVKLKSDAEKDTEIGGVRYTPAVAAAKRAISKFGTPAFRKMCDDYGVGAHPEMIRLLSRVAAATGETPSLGNGDGPGAVQDKPLHEILYKDS